MIERRTPLKRSTNPIPRGKRPNAKRPGPARRGRVIDKPYLDYIRRLRCMLCYRDLLTPQADAEKAAHGEKIWSPRFPPKWPSEDCHQQTPTEAAHVGERGLGQKCSDRETLPLCMEHHRTGPASHHVLGKKFWKRWGIDRDSVIAELNRIYEMEHAK